MSSVWDLSRCRHCGHSLHVHALGWPTEDDSDCYEIECMCPGFEPREDDDGI